MNYIDLFAGAGGLSEGFINSGFTPIAHLEMDEHACDTLKTRIAYYYLKPIFARFKPKPLSVKHHMFKSLFRVP